MAVQCARVCPYRLLILGLIAVVRTATADAPCDPASVLLPFPPQVAGSHPHGIAIADLNGDGRPDVAVANSNYPPKTGQAGTVTVHWGSGDGHFGVGASISVPGDPFHIVAGDFDRDGNADLISGDYLTGSVYLLRGQGTGPAANFLVPVAYAAGPDPTFLVARDLNADGRLDLVALNLTAGTISVLLGQIGTGNGLGLFAVPTTYVLGNSTSYPATATAGDFNGDGIADLAVVLYGPSQIDIVAGTGSGGVGDGGFGPPTVISIGNTIWNVEARDFNGDAILDLAVTNANGMRVLIGHGSAGHGDGTFSPPNYYSAGGATQGMAVSDYTRDGILDCVLAVAASNRLALLVGTGTGGVGDGGFSGPQSYIADTQPYSLEAGDVNGDGHPDLIAANYGADNFTAYLDSCGTGGPVVAFAPLVGRWTAQGLPVSVGTGQQRDLTGIADGLGGAILTWRDGRSSSGNRVYAVRLNVSGQVVPGWTPGGAPVCTSAPDQGSPSIVSDGVGGAIIAWHDTRDGYLAIYAQRLLAGGAIAPGWQPEGVRVCAASSQTSLSMDADGLGGAILAAADWRDNLPVAVYAYRITGAGTVPTGWPAAGLPVERPYSLSSSPGIVSDGAGGGYVAFRTYTPTCSQHGCPPERYYAELVRVFGSASTSVMDITAGVDAAAPPTVASDGAAGLLYEMGRTGSWDLSRIYASGAPGWSILLPTTFSPWNIAPDGQGGVLAGGAATDRGLLGLRLGVGGVAAPGWSVTGTVVSPAGPWYTPSTTRGPDGGAYFGWVDYRFGVNDLYAVRLTAAGTLADGWTANGNPFCTVASTHDYVRMIADGIGGAILMWTDDRNGTQDVFAQRLSADIPVPAQLSLVSADAAPDRVRLAWYAPDAAGREFDIHRRAAREDWRSIAVAAADGSGRIVFEDRQVTPGRRYEYRIRLATDGDSDWTGRASVEVPIAFVLALAGASPNPAAGEVSVQFTLASAGPSTLELIDASGRIVRSRSVGGLGAGPHQMGLGSIRDISPGVFFLRLRQAGESRAKKVAIVR
jgi:hypothetical protein